MIPTCWKIVKVRVILKAGTARIRPSLFI
jgi:hypothetical protein